MRIHGYRTKLHFEHFRERDKAVQANKVTRRPSAPTAPAETRPAPAAVADALGLGATVPVAAEALAAGAAAEEAGTVADVTGRGARELAAGAAAELVTGAAVEEEAAVGAIAAMMSKSTVSMMCTTPLSVMMSLWITLETTEPATM